MNWTRLLVVAALILAVVALVLVGFADPPQLKAGVLFTAAGLGLLAGAALL